MERREERLSVEVSVKDPLYTFFHPRGVAIIGASSNPSKLGHGVIRNFVEHGYEGEICPVNPRGGEILGVPVYTSVAEVPDPVDLGVIILAADYAAMALEDCGKRGIKAVVIISGGFGELGISGREREQELREIARRYDMRFIGPNCVGVIDTYVPIDTTFVRTMPSQGSIGFVSHSGAVCGGTMDWANAVGVGFSRVMSLGNQVDVDVADSLDSLAVEPHTRVVAAYVEGLPNGRKFVESAARLTPHKPLLVLKAGRTPSGTRAVASHTGALAGADQAFMAACQRAGAIPVEDLEQLIDGSLALAYRQPPKGTGMAILTNAGGPAAVGADALDRQGLHLVDLSTETQARLQLVCPPGAQTSNPVDMLGGPRPEQFTQALKILVEAPEVDGVMVVYVPQAITPPQDVADAVSRVGTNGHPTEKPIVCNIAGGGGIRRAARTLHAHGVPHYITPARAAFGLGTLWRYRQIQERQERAAAHPEPVLGVDYKRVHALVETFEEMFCVNGRQALDPQAGTDLARAYGLSAPVSGLAATAEAAVALAEQAGYPVALKRVAPGVVHKADVGGVVLGLSSA
ncbi:MAG TPA: CoA-binding protein, partial [Chloroflexi bacterium]|nr:CoA-binding protein [Chloroflexota bacterium]